MHAEAPVPVLASDPQLPLNIVHKEVCVASGHLCDDHVSHNTLRNTENLIVFYIVCQVVTFARHAQLTVLTEYQREAVGAGDVLHEVLDLAIGPKESLSNLLRPVSVLTDLDRMVAPEAKFSTESLSPGV